MRKYDSKTAREKMHVEIDTNVKMYGEGEPIGVVRGFLDDRRVDHKFRIRNETLEEMYNYFDQGELFHQVEWTQAANAHFDEEHETIRSGAPERPEDGNGTPINEWLHTVPAHNLIDDLTEIWYDMHDEPESDNH